MSEPKVQPADSAQPQAPSNPTETILYQAPAPETAPAYKPEQPMMTGQPAQQQQQPTQSSEWNAGLCRCCSPFTSCLMACCAPCVSMLLSLHHLYSSLSWLRVIGAGEDA